MNIGIVGLGRMGHAMAERLVALGHEVTVWSRTRRDVKGSTFASNPCALTDACEVIITSLLDGSAVRQVYLGERGICAADLAGRLVLDTSTVTPQVSREVAALVQARGGRFVDTPVLGTVGPCKRGELIAMVGADEDDLPAARAALDPLTRTVHHMGPIGSGNAAKLAVNLVMGSYWAALGDGLALARQHAIDEGQLIDIIQSGPAALACLSAKRPVLNGELKPVEFDIAGYVKDLRTISEAAGPDLDLPVLRGVIASYSAAVDAGQAGRDVVTVALRGAKHLIRKR